MRRIVDFPGKTQLLIEDNRVRVILSGSTLATDARLSVHLGNNGGIDLQREIRHQQIAYVQNQPDAIKFHFDVGIDGSVLLENEDTRVLIHLDHNSALVATPTRVKMGDPTAATHMINTVVSALGWKPESVVAPTALHRLLSVAFQEGVRMRSTGEFDIKGVPYPLRYDQQSQAFTLQANDVQSIQAATGVLSNAFKGADPVDLNVIGYWTDDAEVSLGRAAVNVTCFATFTGQIIHVVDHRWVYQMRTREVVGEGSLHVEVTDVIGENRHGVGKVIHLNTEERDSLVACLQSLGRSRSEQITYSTPALITTRTRAEELAQSMEGKSASEVIEALAKAGLLKQD